MIEKKVLEKLYQVDKLSMSEIASRLKVSTHKVSWWMERYGVNRRSLSEATYVKRNPNGDPFKIKTFLSPEERELKGLGLGIFWGEGGKTNKIAIKLGNTDSNLIKKFVEFLKVICGVPKEKLRYSLMIFNDSDPNKASEFWTSELNIELKQLGKVTIIPPQGKGTYKNKSKHGVLIVGCYNSKLRKWIDEQLDLLKN